MLGSLTNDQLIAATLAGELHTIRKEIPCGRIWDGSASKAYTEDDFAFLSDQETVLDDESLVDTITDERGYNLLDLICEQVTLGRLEETVPEHLAAVTLELIVNKGACAGDATLRMLYEAEEYATFMSFANRVQRFRRTIGMFGLAAFNFNSLGQTRVIASQGWSVRRLYGVASIIHGDMPSSNIASACFMLTEHFLHLLNEDQGPSDLRRFALNMAGREDMMNSIRDNHAHRFLTTMLKTPGFERQVQRHAGSSAQAAAEIHAFDRLISHTILLADDHSDQRMKIACWLIARGYKVIEAHDGREALTLFERCRSKVELLLSDFGMPEMDGFNLAAKIRESGSQIPIIINTLPPIHPSLHQEANRLGVSLIAKFDENLLLHNIREALTHRDLTKPIRKR